MSAPQNFAGISPMLWFDSNAEEAADFYVSVFPNSRRLGQMRMPDNKVITVQFELDGQRMTALNGGPLFHFSEAISFVIPCDSQEEIDRYWAKLTADGGSESQCGWLKDKFGLSWQVVPANLGQLLRSPAAFQAMMGMKKLNIAVLEAAGSGQ